MRTFTLTGGDASLTLPMLPGSRDMRDLGDDWALVLEVPHQEPDGPEPVVRLYHRGEPQASASLGWAEGRGLLGDGLAWSVTA